MKCGVETVQISLLPTSAKMVDVRRHFEPVRFVWQRRWRRSVLLALSIARVSLVYVKPECLKDLFGALNHFSWGRLHSAPVETILGQTHHHPPPLPASGRQAPPIDTDDHDILGRCNFVVRFSGSGRWRFFIVVCFREITGNVAGGDGDAQFLCWCPGFVLRSSCYFELIISTRLTKLKG